MSMELWRQRYRALPVTPVKRELAQVLSEAEEQAAPVLCVTGDARGAAAFTEHWLPHIASRGHGAYAVSVRGQGSTPKEAGGRQAMVHDLVQTAAQLPRQAILIGHDKGAALVAHALARYPAAAAVLLAPKGVKAAPGDPVGSPRVLVAGSPDDRKTSAKSLETAARAYGGTPLLFPGVGHDFMNDPGWQAPLDAILDWLENKQAAVG
ncbi:alpha/beta hydrolase [Stackebrandtia nassauensis]|uniref:AB hydrolase-1 domain-containing protein n=1 Tax=Stackebrandtia nassauensis (strain DSM 44728 / CIP 108903 / NRRL B-16338 / NBRC 102104 / LLR-40K-21) TaxID=446470 RepID=D3Q9N8_STANL|nr:alpha/beta fold hydrolase [Stackebrandtia nassauensis]ADD44584.1 hypothetical protein Snas_4943 [Stackebrandtia nassauensis DSM 44728]